VLGDWYLWFPLAAVQHLVAAAFDHRPILLTWRRANNVQKKCHRFRYEVMWEAYEAFTSFLAESWQQDCATDSKGATAQAEGGGEPLGQLGVTNFWSHEKGIKVLEEGIGEDAGGPQSIGAFLG
jgi:hypothetical protein